MTAALRLTALFFAAAAVHATEFHVATTGRDSDSGRENAPLRTIQRAAELAQPGDTVTVHEGVYRERVDPPRGGASEAKRIVYRAAPGEHVEIKGSEVVRGWARVQGGVWKVTLPNRFFGDFNPYEDVIRGDWFDGRGRVHHTGAVYLDGDWLTEAASLDEVLLPPDEKPAWLAAAPDPYLLNVAWLRSASNEARTPAAGFTAMGGVQAAPCSEGGECIGWIEDGDWAVYEGVNMGARTTELAIRAASVTEGGTIEVRLGSAEGRLIGACDVTHTGDWQKWATFTAAIEPQSGPTDLCLVFRSRGAPEDRLRARGLNPNLWFAEVDDRNTTIWAQFGDADPNARLVEINVRQSVFYPSEPQRNYITVRGFTMRHAATPWAPPTAEQIGLIGTHWSKGWVIEDNVISHSVCTGVTLGKHGDEYDNTSANTAEGYVATIERAHAFDPPWTAERVGGHVVRNNTISHCEQAGLVGSLGAAFSTIEGNDIHDVHLRALFGGAEMAGVKIHAAIDATIRGNHIHRTVQGLWLDWMAQGARVSGNLFHDNVAQDVFVEVNHGPFLMDNNLFLSRTSLADMSEGGAFVHNLFAGRISNCPELGRETPYHPAHSTVVAGLARIEGGDQRFYNNIFIGDGTVTPPEQRGDLSEARWIAAYGLWGYDGRKHPILAAGNVYYNGAEPAAGETDAIVAPELDPGLRLAMENQAVWLRMRVDGALSAPGRPAVTTEFLGRPRVAGQPYENPDGSPLAVDRDYAGDPRDGAAPVAGPFAAPSQGELEIRVR